MRSTAIDAGSLERRMTPIAAGNAVPAPTALVRTAVEALSTQFYEPLRVRDLLRNAWTGATAALSRGGGAITQPPPDYPTDVAAAYALHDETGSAIDPE
jgi:hypothetical protein